MMQWSNTTSELPSPKLWSWWHVDFSPESWLIQSHFQPISEYSTNTTQKENQSHLRSTFWEIYCGCSTRFYSQTTWMFSFSYWYPYLFSLLSKSQHFHSQIGSNHILILFTSLNVKINFYPHCKMPHTTACAVSSQAIPVSWLQSPTTRWLYSRT